MFSLGTFFGQNHTRKNFPQKDTPKWWTFERVAKPSSKMWQVFLVSNSIYVKFQGCTLPETNSECTPENWCLEGEIASWDGLFLGGTMLVLGRVRISWWIPIWAGAPRRTDVPLLKILSQTRLLEELGLEGCSWEVRNHASMDNMTRN